MPCWQSGHLLGMRGSPPPVLWLWLTRRRKCEEVSPHIHSHFRPAVMDSVMPSQGLVATLHRHYISLSSFPWEQEFPTPGSCQVARPSCASEKVNCALCLSQGESGLIVLHGRNQGCVYLLGFAGLMLRGMCSRQWLSSAPCAANVGCKWALPSLYQAGMYMLRGGCINRWKSRHSLKIASAFGWDGMKPKHKVHITWDLCMLRVGWWCSSDCHLLSPCISGPCILPSVQLSCCTLLLHMNDSHLFCCFGLPPYTGRTLFGFENER